MSKYPYDDVLRATDAELEVGDWRVFPTLNRIACGGESVALQNLSMQVLLYLSRQPGAVVTYEELLQALWPGRYAAEDAVHRRIADLRRNLRDNARAPRYIETIHKRGYRLIAKVQRPACGVRERLSRDRSQVIVLGAAVMAGLMILGFWSS